MSLRLHALLAALALMLAPVAPALAGDAAEAADPGAPLAKTYPVWISLDAGGRVTAVDVEAGTSAPVATIVAGLVRDTTFAPATRDGVAVASEVPATVGVLFTPAGGGYAATLRWLKVQPTQAERMMPARYPSRELRGAIGGWATVGYVVGPDGRADVASVELLDQGAWHHKRLLGAGDAASKTFATATRDSVAQWTFRMARLDGAPVAARLATPMTFRPYDRSGKSDDLPAFARAAQAAVPEALLLDDTLRLPAPAAALPDAPPATTDDIRITGSRVRRTEVGGP